MSHPRTAVQDSVIAIVASGTLQEGIFRKRVRLRLPHLRTTVSSQYPFHSTRVRLYLHSNEILNTLVYKNHNLCRVRRLLLLRSYALRRVTDNSRLKRNIFLFYSTFSLRQLSTWHVFRRIAGHMEVPLITDCRTSLPESPHDILLRLLHKMFNSKRNPLLKSKNPLTKPTLIFCML